MIFYDFEVFKYDWMVCVIDTDSRRQFPIVNDREQLTRLYNEHHNDIWVGYNSKHYDQYILKGILLGMNPKEINDWIIVERKEGWAFSNEFRRVPIINYDCMVGVNSLKRLEGFMGHDIRETSVDFNIDRKLTKEEIDMTIKYCMHDVEETFEVFNRTIDVFNAMYGIVKAFDLPFKCIGDSEARITAKVLECKKHDFGDEFDFTFEPCIQIKKYHDVVEWFKGMQGAHPDDKKKFYKQSYKRMVAGIPHTFGFGGIHGAPAEPCYYEGALYHVDVNNYYPSYLIAHNRVTRGATNDNYKKVYMTRKELKRKQRSAKTKAEAKKWKKAQLPYKKLLNALSGAMKDPNNPAYDPRMNNTMCINGQLMLLDLIEHLEVIPGFVLIQSNTDGLIVKIPDNDEAFNMMDDICYEWERRCSTDRCEILLELDCIYKIYQKDVNNYLWIDLDGGLERKGAYVKELSPLDYDLPIVNEALVNYMAHGTPIDKTINECNDLIKFQKIVKLSKNYDYVGHETFNGIDIPSIKEYTYNCYRVFASKDAKDGRLLKFKKSKNKGEKFANTPDHCFIYNDDVTEEKVPRKLDKQYYIDIANVRLHDKKKGFGL